MIYCKYMKLKIPCQIFLRCISQSEIRNSAAAKARAGREFIFPTPLFLPAPPERLGSWRAKRAVSSVQNRFGFGQTNAPSSTFRNLRIIFMIGRRTEPTADLTRLTNPLLIFRNKIVWLFQIEKGLFCYLLCSLFVRSIIYCKEYNK